MLTNACPKPGYGTAKLERLKRVTKRTSRGKNVKAQAKQRDGHKCRYPDCELQKKGFVLDGAHLKAAGMGGNPDESRMTLENIISACRVHHKGAFSMHSGDIKPVPRDPMLGANGIVDWYISDEQEGQKWVGATAPTRRVAADEEIDEEEDVA